MARYKMGRIIGEGEGRRERTEKQALAPHPKATLTLTPMTTTMAPQSGRQGPWVPATALNTHPWPSPATTAAKTCTSTIYNEINAVLVALRL